MAKTMTVKQLAANRKNAKHGGVKTPAGKAVSRYNALKHGLLSKEVLLKGEDKKALEELGKRIRSDFEPATELELLLVDRIVANVWRLRRVMQIECEMMTNDCAEKIYDPMDEIDLGPKKVGPLTLGAVFTSDLGHHDRYIKFTKYEAHIERSIYKALHELERLQAVRSGKKVSTPLAIDVDVAKD